MKLTAVKLSIIILVTVIISGCKILSNAIEFPIQLGLLPVLNTEMVDLQNGLFAYRISRNTWPSDSATFSDYVSTSDSLEISFENFKTLSFITNMDTLWTYYYHKYANTDTLQYQMIEGMIRMIWLTNDTADVDIKYYLDRLETLDGKVITLPNGYGLWTKKQNAP